jgi:hypothetical protein
MAAKGKPMARETRVTRRINWQKGILKDKAGLVVKVQFNLIQTQDFLDGMPMLKRAEGSLEFESGSDAWNMTSMPESKTLVGGGIRAEVIVMSENSFKTTGPIVDI